MQETSTWVISSICKTKHAYAFELGRGDIKDDNELQLDEPERDIPFFKTEIAPKGKIS